MSSRSPLALSPALLVVRILACVAFLPAGIQDLAMMEFTGEDAAKVRRLMQPVPTPAKTEGLPVLWFIFWRSKPTVI